MDKLTKNELEDKDVILLLLQDKIRERITEVVTYKLLEEIADVCVKEYLKKIIEMHDGYTKKNM